MKVLVLGGTAESAALIERLGSDPRYDAEVSFAGRTQAIRRPATPFRVGGFGGVDGLVGYLSERRFDALIDATHPFAARISANAVAASARLDLPFARLVRREWRTISGDRWLDAHDMSHAVELLGSTPRKVFLAIGRLEVAAFGAAPQHEYLLRTVDAFEPPEALTRARTVIGRGPFELEAERALLVEHGIEVVVSKNSGTPATYAKIEAARGLGLSVIMVRRPFLPPAPEFEDSVEVIASLERGVAQRRLRFS